MKISHWGNLRRQKLDSKIKDFISMSQKTYRTNVALFLKSPIMAQKFGCGKLVCCHSFFLRWFLLTTWIVLFALIIILIIFFKNPLIDFYYQKAHKKNRKSHTHDHGSFVSIDYLAYSSNLRHWNSNFKFVLSLLTIVFSLTLNKGRWMCPLFTRHLHRPFF